jgi:hypothetical protein
VKLPGTQTIAFDAIAAPAPRLWAEAEPLALDEDLRREARALVAALAEAQRRKNAPALAELFGFAIRDKALANHEAPPADLTAALREGLAAPDMPAMEPVAPERLTFELVGGGRLLHVLGPDGREALHSRPGEDGTVSLPVYLARVGGKLVPAR